jgi:Flp pilus assembly pilin Flp
MVEYALVASFMGLASVAGVNGLASKIAGDMNLVLNGFNAALASHS